MTKFFTTAALAAVLAAPMAAEAATTMFAGNTYADNGVVTTTSDVTFDFIAGEALQIGTIGMTGNGPTPNVSAINILLTPPGGTPGSFAFIMENNGQEGGISLESGLTLALGDTFQIVFSGPVGANVDVDYNFTTSSVPGTPPVPLPAAGGMLLFAVVAGGIAGRRKTKKA